MRTPEENRLYMRRYYAENKHRWPKRSRAKQEEYNATRRANYAASEAERLKARAQVKAWQAANPRKRKGQRLRRFGITVDQFDDLLRKQRGGCAICGFSDQSRKLIFPIVDHCHKTGIVRGLVCAGCNHGLGKFKDDWRLLERAIKYLRTPRSHK